MAPTANASPLVDVEIAIKELKTLMDENKLLKNNGQFQKAVEKLEGFVKSNQKMTRGERPPPHRRSSSRNARSSTVKTTTNTSQTKSGPSAGTSGLKEDSPMEVCGSSVKMNEKSQKNNKSDGKNRDPSTDAIQKKKDQIEKLIVGRDETPSVNEKIKRNWEETYKLIDDHGEFFMCPECNHWISELQIEKRERKLPFKWECVECYEEFKDKDKLRDHYMEIMVCYQKLARRDKPPKLPVSIRRFCVPRAQPKTQQPSSSKGPET